MAASIFAGQRHPLQTFAMDSDLALVLELEDPLLMSKERLEGLLEASRPGDTVEPAVWGYLYGIWEQRTYGKRLGGAQA